MAKSVARTAVRPKADPTPEVEKPTDPTPEVEKPTEPTPEVQEPEAEKIDDPWADLPEAEPAVYTRGETAEDVEKTTPETIKAKAVESFKDSGNWKWQECGTPERAQLFVKSLRKYCNGKAEPWTLRVGTLEPKQTKVRYMVKAKEHRKRQPKTDVSAPTVPPVADGSVTAEPASPEGPGDKSEVTAEEAGF